MVEHRLCKAGVRGSSPLVSTPAGATAASPADKLVFDGQLDVPAALKWLSAHTTPGVDVVVEGSYRRATGEGVLEIRPAADGIEVSILGSDRRPTPAELRQVRFVLDLDRDLDVVNATLRRDPILGPLVDAHPGLRIMGAWSPFEALIRVVLGQQVSVAGARTLAGRLVLVAGHRLQEPGAHTAALPHLAFPGPAELAAADLAAVGLTGARSRTISGLARAVDAGVLAAGPGENPGGAQGWLDDLARQPGIGPWTIAYLAMRVLRDADAWPAGDLVLRRACAAQGLEMAEAAVSFRPWRAYAATHLWESIWVGPATTVRRAARPAFEQPGRPVE